MLLATLIGQPIFTVGAGTLVAGLGLGASNMGLIMAGMFAVATFFACTVLKLYFRRNRPVTEYVAKMRFDTYSMPSGHAAGAAASFGLLALLVCQTLAAPWSYLFAVFIAGMIVFIGISRIYLGAHYPSDVFVGWILGLMGLGAIIVVAQPYV
jgi:undecaprenyl-diphosphatase